MLSEKSGTIDGYANLILIPTDFSRVCDNAVHHGVELAKVLDCKVCLLHVVNNSGKKTGLFSKGTGAFTILKKLNAIKAKYDAECDIEFDVLVKNGVLLQVIDEVAIDRKACLMIVGTHGKQGFQQYFGSHALKIAVEAPCPVIIVQGKPFGKGYRNIVLPVSCDFDPKHSLYYLDMMSRLYSASIHLIHSNETDPERMVKVNTMITETTAILSERKIKHFVVSAEKNEEFSSQVLTYAVETKADLIMIQAYPGNNSPGFSFSSWNERMMFDENQIPVMSFTPPDQEGYQ